MSRTLNKVQLIGRLGADPQLRYTQAGTPVATFSLATNRQWERDGERHEETDWHNIVAWDKLAQLCSEYLTKGRLVYIEGRLQYRSWEFEGQTRYKTEIVATDMLILDSKGTPATEEVTPQEKVVAEPPAEQPIRKAPARAERSERYAGAAVGRQPVMQTVAGEDDPDDLPF